MSIYSYPSAATAAPVNAFQAGLNQLAAQVQQLQAQTATAGASAYNNAALIQSFNALCNTVGQYQASVTNAGANGAPYQPTLNALDAQLNQIKTTLTTPTAAPTTGFVPFASQMPTDTYSAGLNALSSQITQLQSQIAAAGATAADNPTILASYRSVSQSLNSYIDAVNNSGAAATNPTAVASLNALKAQMYQVRATLEADYRASHNGVLPTTGAAPVSSFPTGVSPVGTFPTTNPYGVYNPAMQNNPLMPIVGAIGAIAGIVGMFQNNRHH